MPRIKYSDEQRTEMISKVDALRGKGLNLDDACAKAKVSKSYYSWAKARYGAVYTANQPTQEQPRSNHEVQLVRAPLQREGRGDQMIALIGHPDDVQRALETLVKK
jgi:hypothetical protein